MEVNEATMEEAIKYGHFLKKSEEDIAEAINIYVTQLRSGEDPELQNTPAEEAGLLTDFNYSPTEGDGSIRAIWSSPG